MEPAAQFDREVAFDPEADFEAFSLSIPAKWAVYLMSDAQGQPVQLLCVKNLRYSIRKRLAAEEQVAGPSRRVDYRGVVRRISWRRVDSAFEADCVYLEFARAVFPKTYQGMVGFRPAWFVHVNPDAAFPRYTKTIDLSIRTGVLMGPLEDKHAAGKLIEQAADWFDLCRYYQILIESPHGKACAYKEMGKCPAPCDGTISMTQYRRLVDWSARSIIDPSELLREQQGRMKSAAAEMRFETAGKIKAFIDSLAQLGKGTFRHLRRLSDFQFLSFQRGPREGTAKVFLITPGQVREIAGLPMEPSRPADVLRLALTLAAEAPANFLDEVGAERVGVVTHHLFLAKATHGVFLPLEDVDEKAIVRAWKDLAKQKVEPESQSEGVTKELQSL